MIPNTFRVRKLADAQKLLSNLTNPITLSDYSDLAPTPYAKDFEYMLTSDGILTRPHYYDGFPFPNLWAPVSNLTVGGDPFTPAESVYLFRKMVNSWIRDNL